MVREFLRMSHVSTDERLKDINLAIFEGEIVFLMSNHRGELEEIWKVISGKRKSAAGAWYVEEEPVSEYEERFCAGHGIFHIDAGTQLAEKMSIEENIFVIQVKKWSQLFSSYNRKAVRAETREVLKRVGLSCEPDTKVWQLSSFERFLVCVAKAIVSRARLLLIDDLENEYNSSEKRKIRELLLYLKTEGIASLILADRPGELLESAGKIVLVKNGRDIKTYFSQDKKYFTQKNLYEAIARAWIEAPGKKGKDSYKNELLPKYPGICIRGTDFTSRMQNGKIYGFYDAFWNKEKDFKDYLAYFERQNRVSLVMETEEDSCSVEELLSRGKAVYIPKNSAFLLLENMTIGQNIAVPNRERASGRSGMSVRRIDRYMEKEFCREHGVNTGTPLWELSCMQKKILSIHRLLYGKPSLVILENPTYRLNLQEADGIREYLRKLADLGLILLVSEGSFYEEELFCDTILCMENGRYRATIDKDDYSKVRAEWLL